MDGGPHRVGVIASVTRPFCAACDRTRLTADGQIRTCLFATEETDLRAALRSGARTRRRPHLAPGDVGQEGGERAWTTRRLVQPGPPDVRDRRLGRPAGTPGRRRRPPRPPAGPGRRSAPGPAALGTARLAGRLQVPRLWRGSGRRSASGSSARRALVGGSVSGPAALGAARLAGWLQVPRLWRALVGGSVSGSSTSARPGWLVGFRSRGSGGPWSLFGSGKHRSARSASGPATSARPGWLVGFRSRGSGEALVGGRLQALRLRQAPVGGSLQAPRPRARPGWPVGFRPRGPGKIRPAARP